MPPVSAAALPPVPAALGLAFVLTTLLATWLFWLAARRSGRVLGLALAWLALQGAVAASGFYTLTAGLPPRLALALAPPTVLFIGLLLARRGRAWLAGLRLPVLTLLHVVRVPVELVLWSLCAYGAVPRIMTFEGRNFDILAGLTAPVVYYLAFHKRVIGRRGLLLWNIGCLGLLLNIVVTAVLSAPSPVQRFGFGQPNVAVLHFPYAWLPAVVVPLVLLAHLAALWQLARLPAGRVGGKGAKGDAALSYGRIVTSS